MEKDQIRQDGVAASDEREADDRLPYTTPRIESSDAFESFTLNSCGLIPGGCIDGTNP